jgi:ectoine hydroxylase-related dioxygenase (phytanoyl-CoA dioxygenase family)
MGASPESYPLTQEQVDGFHRDGWTVLPDFLDEEQLRSLERDYMRLLRREVPVRGRDYCDMAGHYDRPIEEFELLNVMLPRVYLPALQGNAYERRAAYVVEELLGADFVLDYDQLVAKPPGREGAVFHWHQDLGYWPITEDTRTATFWLALDDVDDDNGCVRFVDGSHLEPELRQHVPLQGGRDSNHTLVAEVDPARDRVRSAVMKRGSVTVHHERTVHGSQGNGSDRWRRGYVLAFRSRETVAQERAMGFTHSHNDDVQVLTAIGEQTRRRRGGDA